MSGPTLAAVLAVAAIIGASAGVAFNRWWVARRPPAVPPPLPVASLPSVAAPGPTILFAATPVRPAVTAEVFESGAPVVYCFYAIPDESPEAEVSAWWLSATTDPVAAVGEVTREPGADLRGRIALRPPARAKAFADGIYEVSLRVDGEPVAEGSFALLKGAAELLQRPSGLERYRPEVKDVVVFTGKPTGPVPEPYVLPSGTMSVRVAFSYAHALSGTAFTVQWLYEDGLIQQATTEVVIRAAEGRGHAWFATKPPQPLPAGKYAVLISVGEGTPPLGQEPFWIGRTPRPDELGSKSAG
jgi:hypothetical protein